MKLHFDRIALLKRSTAFLASLAGLALCGVAVGQTYDPVKEFSLKSNPNGVWSYGTLSSVELGKFTPFTVRESDTSFMGERLWYTGNPIPYGAAVSHNASHKTVQTSVTVVLQPNEVDIDGQDLIADLRFTTPVSGMYSITGLFHRLDIYANPVNLYIIKDGKQVLFSINHFTVYGSIAPFQNLSPVYLAAGSTVDFVESATQYNNDGTGVQARITRIGSENMQVPIEVASLTANGGIEVKAPGNATYSAPATGRKSSGGGTIVTGTPSGRGNDNGALDSGTAVMTEHYAVSISGAISSEETSGSSSALRTAPISNAAILNAIALSDTTETLQPAGLDIVMDLTNFNMDVIDRTTHQLIETIGRRGPSFAKVTAVASSSNGGDNATLCYTDYELFLPGITNAAQSLTIVFYAKNGNAPGVKPGSTFSVSFVGGKDDTIGQFMQGFIRKTRGAYIY